MTSADSWEARAYRAGGAPAPAIPDSSGLRELVEASDKGTLIEAASATIAFMNNAFARMHCIGVDSVQVFSARVPIPIAQLTTAPGDFA